MRQLNTLIAASSVELRSRVKEALEATRHVQTSKIAASGRLALQMLEYGSIDLVVTQDSLPDMTDGELFDELHSRGYGAHVIVVSDAPMITARAAKDRLKHGRLHFIESPKVADKASDADFKRFVIQVSGILEKIQEFKSPDQVHHQVSKPIIPGQKTLVVPDVAVVPRVDLDKFKPRVICVGASTGGPAALEVVFSRMRGKSRVPILVVQHMPAGFTESLAARIQLISGLQTAEAKAGETLKAGRVYVAPGDYHMRLVMDEGNVAIHLDHGPKRNSVRPCVDVLFETAAQIYMKNALAMVLTGMGEDGLVGAQSIKKNGGAVIIQNKESSVVWGMPGSIHAAGIYDSMGDLERCADLLALMALRG